MIYLAFANYDPVLSCRYLPTVFSLDSLYINYINLLLSFNMKDKQTNTLHIRPKNNKII